jgi:GWxTD domain-containing protein
MDRFRLSHILRCGLIAPILVTSFATTQDRDAAAQVLSASYQKWLDEDVGYLISDEERAEYKGLKTDQQRDMFVEDFWERRNQNPGSTENRFKEEHYRRLVYVNEQFAADVPGYRTDRGRIYILYGPPDEREQHPGSTDIGIPASAPPTVRYPSDVWRYRFIDDIGWDVVFEFIDYCRCGKYQLREDPTKKPPPSTKERQLRFAYATEHFAVAIPGWKTDRGRIYIRYGAPDQIDQHFSAAGSRSASDLAGIGAIPYDWELWHYRYIEGIGKDVMLEFVDTCGCGRYEMPVTKEALNKYKPR